MNDETLNEIEMRANAILAEMTHARTRCDHCDAVDPPVDDRGRHDGCPDADESPTKVGRDETRLEGVAGHCEIAGHMLTLVAEVRRLTAALAAHQGHTDAAVDGVRAMLPGALDIARREGAEAMLARCRTAAREAFDSHPLTLDSRHEPGCICYAIGRGSCSECDRGDAVVDALDALPLVAPTAAPATDGAT